MRQRRPFLAPVTALAAALPSLARACPFCASDTAEKVRAGIFDENFFPTAFAALAPFPILFLFVALLYFGPSLKVRKDRTGAVAREARAVASAPEGKP